MARLHRNRVTPRASFQPRNDMARGIADAHAKKIVRSLKNAMKHLRSLVPVKTVAHAIRLGSMNGVISSIGFDHYKEVLKEPMQLVGDAYEAAGRHGAGILTSRLRRGGKALRYRPVRKDTPPSIGYAFDRFDENTQARLLELLDSMISDLSSSAIETVNSLVISGLRAGDSADEIAASIRDTISLTADQAEAVSSYRRALEDLDSNALGRALRDSSYDSLVESAIDSGEFLSDKIISDAVDAYMENYLDYRAATIARTESIRAANAGLRDSYQQASERGVIPEDAVRRMWLLDLDEVTCPVCIDVADQTPDGVGLNEDFPLGDPPLHPNCRCTIQYETNLDKVPDEEAA